MTLDATISVELVRSDRSGPAFGLHDVTVRIADGETVALVGPNGAGKTTALRVLMGLVPLTRGKVIVDDIVMDDPDTDTFVPVDQRRIGAVFQDVLLFPHLSVLDNVAFGVRARGASTREARTVAAAQLEAAGLSHLATAKPRTLSGGQAQRVALTRALAVEPRLLLLDEPLTALDVSSRPEVRRELARHLATFDGAALVITHDPVEAMTLADRIVVVEDGRVTQEGTPTEVREQPRTRYVADVAGVNLYRGVAGPDGLVVDDDGSDRDRPRNVLVSAQQLSGPAFAVVHPRAVALHARQPEGTPRNVWHGVVRHIDPEGERARVHVDAPIEVTAEITTAALAELALVEGAPVWASVKATEVTLYPA